jgi:hypothetical protein
MNLFKPRADGELNVRPPVGYPAIHSCEHCSHFVIESDRWLERAGIDLRDLKIARDLPNRWCESWNKSRNWVMLPPPKKRYQDLKQNLKSPTIDDINSYISKGCLFSQSFLKWLGGPRHTLFDELTTNGPHFEGPELVLIRSGGELTIETVS